MATPLSRNLIDLVDDLSTRWRSQTGGEFEKAVNAIVEPALSSTGYIFKKAPLDERDHGIDLFTTAGGGTEQWIGVVLKKVERPIRVSEISSLINRTAVQRTHRLILISTAGFTNAALDRAAKFAPVAMELWTLNALRDWVASLANLAPPEQQIYAALISDLCGSLARHIARDATMLHQMEWRDLERLLSEVLTKLGFDVILTPSSQDGGKDLVVRCTGHAHQMFYVEIKHWRAGSRPGKNHVRDFVKVVIRDGVERGLLLSSSGFAGGAFEGLVEIERRRLRTATSDKVVSLCRRYVRACAGLWSPINSLEDILFEDTM